MQNFDTVLFDLDGTLVDSSEGITKSVSYALKKRGYGEHAPETLKHFIGPPSVSYTHLSSIFSSGTSVSFALSKPNKCLKRPAFLVLFSDTFFILSFYSYS